MIKIFQTWLERYFADEEAVLVAVLLIASLLIVASMGVVLAPMIAAIIIAFLMQGMVVTLKAWRVPHIVAVTLTFMTLTGVLVVIMLFLLPAFWRQLINLLNETPKMLVQGQQLMLLLPQKYPDLVTEVQVKELIDTLRSEMTQWGQSILSFSLAQLPVLVAVLIYVVLVPILVFFFLKDSEQMLAWLSNVLPRRRPVMKKIWHEMNHQIANYVRGKAIEIVIVGGASVVAFTLLDLNYALLLGITVGFSVLIPYIGAAVVTVPVALIGFFQWGWGNEFVYVMVAYTIIQTLDGNVLVPLLFSEAVKMHPVLIVLAVLVFGGLWGFWGVFFAIPLATLCKAIFNAWPTASRISDHKAEQEPLA